MRSGLQSPASHYELVSYIRDCPENPENCIMGPSAPVDECSAPFTLNAGETLYARRYAEHTGGPQTRCWLSITHLPLTDGERQLHAWQNIARSPYMVIESATPPSEKDTRIIDSVPAPKDEAIRKIQRTLLSFKQATVMSSPVSGRTPDGECHGVDTRNPSDMFPVAVGHCRFTTTTLKQLILIAYYPLWGTVGKSTELIKGGPDWTASERFELDATAANPRAATEGQLRQMLRTLLKRRFKLQLHPEVVGGKPTGGEVIDYADRPTAN